MLVICQRAWDSQETVGIQHFYRSCQIFSSIARKGYLGNKKQDTSGDAKRRHLYLVFAQGRV
jgi:hypothetical protein